MITVKDVALAVSEIVFSNEGNYASVNKDDNGALSIGKLQWHGERGRELLYKICEGDTELQNMLGGLWSEVLTAGSFKSRTLNKDEAQAVKSVLSSERSKQLQDALAIDDICLDIQRGVGYGLSNCGALMYFADGANQYGRYSKLWKDACEIALSRGGALEELHSAILSLTDAKRERRVRTYEKIKKTEIAECYLGEEKEVDRTYKTETVTHKVVRGATLSKIAKKYGSDIDLILEANREKYKTITRNYIVAGWTLAIPVKKEISEYELALDALKRAGIIGGGITEECIGEPTAIMLYRLLLLLGRETGK